MFPLLILLGVAGGFLVLSGQKKKEPAPPGLPVTDETYYFYYEVNERARGMIQALVATSPEIQKAWAPMKMETVQPDLVPPGYVELTPAEIAEVFTKKANMPVSGEEIAAIQLMALAPPLSGPGGNTIRIHAVAIDGFGAEIVFAPASVATGSGFAPGQLSPGVNDMAVRRVFRLKKIEA